MPRVGVQEIAKQARMSTRWQRHQRLGPVRNASSLPTPDWIEQRCACSSPVVMWEGEYFCVVRGNLSDRCSLAMTAMLHNNDESEYSIRQS
jgi:hypothetical protein